MIIIIVIVLESGLGKVSDPFVSSKSLVVLSSGIHFWHAFGNEHFLCLWETLWDLFLSCDMFATIPVVVSVQPTHPHAEKYYNKVHLSLLVHVCDGNILETCSHKSISQV